MSSDYMRIAWRWLVNALNCIKKRDRIARVEVTAPIHKRCRIVPSCDGFGDSSKASSDYFAAVVSLATLTSTPGYPKDQGIPPAAPQPLPTIRKIKGSVFGI